MAGRWKLLAGLVIVVGLVGGGLYVRSLFAIDVPVYPAPKRTIWLEQNWSDQARAEYHHLSQETRTFYIPFEWFMALEQAELRIGDAGPLSDQAYLDRFGFIPGAEKPNEPPLPVGFARGSEWIDPTTGEAWTNPASGKTLTSIGLTCAACHTGRMTYKGVEIFVDGAPALINVNQLQQALGVTLFLTKLDPFRFNRFAVRLLGEGASGAAKDALRKQLDDVLGQLKVVENLQKTVNAASVLEGFGRLDALNRIGNQVFSLDLHRPENYVATSAPVNYPHIWDTSWFDWVQYNGSIEQPMVRNAGEALGVRALVNLKEPRPLFESTLDLAKLAVLEERLAGRQPTATDGFSGLRAPAWPSDVLPPIDATRAQRGRGLYGELCKTCHLAPIGDADFWKDENWSRPNDATQRYLRMPMIPIAKLKTDPAQAADMKARRVATPPELELKNPEFGPALGDLVANTTLRWYDTAKTPDAMRAKMNGFRRNGIRDDVHGELAYKARPLDGIWATAPYLHNGSVPTLYALLSPVSDRPKRFPLGQREFDPVNVGYVDTAIAGGSEIDTSLRGNANTGHEFCDKPDACIGRSLTQEERFDLIEFLKTL